MALVPAFTEKPQQQEVRQGILVLVLVRVREMSHHNTQVSTGPTVQSARPEQSWWSWYRSSASVSTDFPLCRGP